MSEDITENLILAIEAMGLPEAAAEVDGLSGSMDDLAASAERADVAVSGGGAADKGGLMAGLTSMKTLFAGLGVAVAVKSFADFQSQMEKLHTQTGATQGEVARMSKGVLSLAFSVGTGPDSLAEAMYHLQSAGYRGKEALDAVRVAAMGAKIGGAELTSTTEAMTAVMLAGFKGVHSLREAMGQLNSIVGAGDMTMEDLNQALGKGLLASMKNLGLQLPDVGAALAVFGDNNIRGAKGATALQEGLYKLLTPSKEVQENMAKLGLTHLQLAEDLRKPGHLLAMLEDLEHRLKGIHNVTERASITAGIFGSGRTASGMLTLMNQMDLLKRSYKEIEKGGKNFNADWIATTHTLSFVIDQLKALSEVVLIKFGGALNSAIGWMFKFGEALGKGKTWAVALTIGLGAVAATVATMTLMASAGTIVLGAYAAAWTALGVVLTLVDAIPIVLLFAAIGVAIYELIVHFKQVKAAAVDVFDWIKGHWRLLLPLLMGPVGLAIDFITAHFHEIAAVGEWVFGVLKTIFNAVKGVLTKPFDEWWSVVKAVATEIVKIVEWLVAQVEKNIGKVLGPLKSFLHLEGRVAGFGAHALSDAGHFLGLANGTPAVTAGGAFMVGERGPEIVYLPKGAAVQPNSEIGGQSGGGGGSPIMITVNSVLDRRVIARSVVQTGLEAQSGM